MSTRRSTAGTSTRRRDGAAGASSSTTATNSSSQTLRPLPPYSPPSSALNVVAIHALENLCSRSTHAKKIREGQEKALERLGDAAAVIYERVVTHDAFYERGRGNLAELERGLSQSQSLSQNQNQGPRRGERGEGEGEGEGENGGEEEGKDKEKEKEKADASTAQLQEKVHAKRIDLKRRRERAELMKKRADEAHEKLEAKVREVIDGKSRMEEYEDVLGEVSGNIQRGEGRVAPTQSTLGASQFRNNTQFGNMAQGDDDDEDERMGEDGAGTQDRGPSALQSMQEKLGERKTKYEASSRRARYAENNDYIGFKRIVHDAIHQDDGVTLPHSNTWFAGQSGENEADGGSYESTMQDPTSAMPGAFTQQTEGQDSDSEIEVAGEQMGTTCPLTLMELEDPMTTPCGHNFEASAILEMVRRSRDRIGGRQETRGRNTVIVGGEPAITCPIASCDKRFTERMLRRDAAVQRKIKRIQAKKRRQSEVEREDYDDDDEDEDGLGAGSRRRRAISVETDVTGTGAQSRRQSMAPPASTARIKSEMRSSMAPAATPSGSGDGGGRSKRRQGANPASYRDASEGYGSNNDEMDEDYDE